MTTQTNRLPTLPLDKLKSVRAIVQPGLGVADQGFAAAVGLIVSIYVGRTVGLAGLGLFALAQVLVLTFRALQNGLVLQPMSVYGPQRAEDERDAYLSFLLLLNGAGLALVSGFVVVGLFVATPGDGSRETLSAFLAALLYVNCFACQNVFRREAYVEQRPAAATLQSVGYLVLVMAGLAGLLAWSQPSVTRVYLVMAASSAIVCVVQVLRHSGRLQRLREGVGRQFGSLHWTFGRWVLFTVPFQMAMYQGYYLLANALLTADEVGMIKAVDTLVVPFDQVGIGLSMLLVPRVARRVDGLSAIEQKAWALRVTRAIGLLGIAYTVFLLLFGKTLLVALFAEEAREATALMPIMALIPLAKALAYPAGILLIARRRPDLVFVANALAATLTLAGGTALMRAEGVHGAATGLLLSVTLFAVTLWVGLGRVWRHAGPGQDPR